MVEINDKESLKIIAKDLYEINQTFKNIYNNKPYYNISNGKVISCYREQLPQYVVGDIHSKSDFFDDKTFTIYWQELFDFDVKKSSRSRELELKSIIYNPEDNSIKFIKDYNEISFDYKNDDIVDYENFIEKISSFDQLIIEDESNEYQFDEETLIDIFNDKNSSFELILPLGEQEFHIYNKKYLDMDALVSFLPFCISNKFLIGNKIKTKKNNDETLYECPDNKIILNASSNEEYNNLYLISITFFGDLLDIEQKFIVTDISDE